MTVGLRITRRGRVALVALVLALAAALGWSASVRPGVEPVRTVTVEAGQTLSGGRAELPSMSISEGILAIQLANRLSTAQVSAGQELVIPRG